MALPLAQLAAASGLDGGVLRIESAPERGGAASVSISLQDLDVGRVSGDVFEVPAGYERRAQLFTGEL